MIFSSSTLQILKLLVQMVLIVGVVIGLIVSLIVVQWLPPAATILGLFTGLLASPSRKIRRLLLIGCGLLILVAGGTMVAYWYFGSGNLPHWIYQIALAFAAPAFIILVLRAFQPHEQSVTLAER